MERPSSTSRIRSARAGSPISPWFANGLRVVDIKTPHAPREVAYFVPDAPKGFERPSSNDVFLTREGLIYLVDRQRGMHILERI